MFDVILQLWMFATPVVYAVRGVGEALHTRFLLNPMTPVIDGYRAVVLRGQLPDPGPLAIAVG
jgi:lipopolysaccharide transport system permease protein